MAKKLMKGSEAIGEAAIQAGCRYFFGYPITPQNEIPEYMSRPPAQGGRVLSTGGKRSRGDQHGLWRGRCGRARDDLLLQPGDQPEAGGDQLYRLRGASVRDRQHDACGARSRRDPARRRATISRRQRVAVMGITILLCWRRPQYRRRRTWSWKGLTSRIPIGSR